MRRRLSAAIVGTIVLLTAFASTTFAECMNWPLEANERPRVAFAFIATVTDVERHEVFEVGSGHFRYRITLETERVYRGRVQDKVELTGTNSGCSFLYKSGLVEGERLFIASERLSPDAHETDLGNVLAWKRTGSRWTFYEDALRDGSDETYYPRAARAATSTAAIVQLLSAAPMPDTATAPPGENSSRESLPGVALLSVVAFIVASRLVSRARSRCAPQADVRGRQSLIGHRLGRGAMRRDDQFWLRLWLGILGLVAAVWLLATTPRGYYLDLPAALIAIAALFVLASAFVPSIRWPRR